VISIIDDFLQKSELHFLQKNIKESYYMKWYDLNDDHFFKDICLYMCFYAKRHFKIVDDIVGYDNWCHCNPQEVKWHNDKDEELLRQTGNLSFPLCSIVYYFNVDDDLIGGDLYFDNGVNLKPKNNRLVLFGPSLFHGVNKHKGSRSSFLVNPWKSKPLGY